MVLRDTLVSLLMLAATPGATAIDSRAANSWGGGDNRPHHVCRTSHMALASVGLTTDLRRPPPACIAGQARQRANSSTARPMT
jgi:hypothetical protein